MFSSPCSYVTYFLDNVFSITYSHSRLAMIIITLTNNFADDARVHLPIQYSINYFIVLPVTVNHDEFGFQIIKNS